MRLQISIIEQIEVPDGSTLETAANGKINSIRLPTGELLKPWLAYEKNEEEDLSTEDLQKLDIEVALEFDREIVEI